MRDTRPRIHYSKYLNLLTILVTVTGGGFEVTCKLLAGYVMPHGGIALDPTHFNTTNTTSRAEAWELHKACVAVGQQIDEIAPDLIFLSTPHGISDLRNFGFYLNPEAQGGADTDNCQCPPCCYNVSVGLDVNVSQRLVGKFGYDRNVSGISGYGPPGQSSEPFPLRWGEVIPLHFVGGPGLSRTRVVILSQPSRRYTEQVAMIPELLKLGSDLYTYLEGLSERVVMIISADLAHTHLADGPYGYSNTSEPFDLAVGEWAGSLDEHALLVTASQLVDRALSCGYTGLVMMHGVFSAGGLSSWQPDLLVNHHPSYYGMMVASITRRNIVLVS
ncbi:LOW QUALITY PROTEIN: uncharacterized protein LOC124274030 [Haliotis rubra]|uniref:LOW QUALITY PROTEIN: uncharacterized protein LOC124274030 n=1 Tax=Haliotis rubra TaxID=36100 RepID=UPI001EE559C6|nr:LOW QUALITY PROTEIN: uncharacterized protein LOC124274030 [Haliotis rubra]